MNSILVAVFGGGAVGAVLVALINAVSGCGRSRADAAKIIAEGSAVLVAPLSAQLREVQNEMSELRQQSEQVADAVSALTRLVDLVAPLIEAEHPNLAAELRAAASSTRITIQGAH